MSSQPIGRKGRPRDPELEMLRGMIPEQSERTRGRLRHARVVAQDLGLSPDDYMAILKEHTRPNGSLNVSAVERFIVMTVPERIADWEFEQRLAAVRVTGHDPLS
jgi:hypothetical protein